MEWFCLFLYITIFIMVILPPLFIYELQWYSCVVHFIILIIYALWTPKKWNNLKALSIVQRFGFDYFNFRIQDPYNTIEQSRTVNTLFIIHPHGVYAITLFSFFCLNTEMHHVKVAGSSLLFRLPIIKDLMAIGGCISVKKEELVLHLGAGSVAMCPGGLRELLLHYNAEKITCLRRKGFISVASQVGNCRIVLVKSPFECKLYSVWTFPRLFFRLQDWCLKNILYPLPIFSWGNNWLPFWPRRPVDGMPILFGKPVEITENLSADDIIHLLYDGPTAIKNQKI